MTIPEMIFWLLISGMGITGAVISIFIIAGCVTAWKISKNALTDEDNS